MSAVNTSMLFPDLDSATIDAAVQTIGVALIAGVSSVGADLVSDDTLSPECMSAAILKAHLLGAISMMRAMPAPPKMATIVTFMFAELDSAKGGS